MNLKIILSILLYCVTHVAHSQEWVKTDITDFATIEFPIKSEITENSQELIFMAVDESGYYVVTTREISKQQSAQFIREDISQLYRGIAQGSIAAANATVISMNEIEIQDIKALELEMDATANSNLPSKRFKQILFVEQTIIILDFWPLTSNKALTLKNKERFFSSFILNLDDSEQNSSSSSIANESENPVYETSFQTGKIIFYIFLFAILFGIVFLIRFLVNRKTKNKLPSNQNQTKVDVLQPVICKHCGAENKIGTKYCSKCGYELI